MPFRRRDLKRLASPVAAMLAQYGADGSAIAGACWILVGMLAKFWSMHYGGA
jgi:hypothetical protein